MSRRHILIARKTIGAPASWLRADWNGSSWVIAYEAATSLAALVIHAIGSLAHADLTITPRILGDLISRGNPAGINVPANGQIQLLLPFGDGTDHWTIALLEPARDVRLLLEKQRFVEAVLDIRLRETLTDQDIEDRSKPHDRRELWLRRDLTAARLFPDQITLPSSPAPQVVDAEGVPLALDRRTPEQHEAEARRDELRTPIQRERAAVAAAKKIAVTPAKTEAEPLQRDPVSQALAEKRQAEHRRERTRKKVLADRDNRESAAAYGAKVEAELKAAGTKAKKR